MNNANNNYPVDFVVLWVDDTDPVWRAKRESYIGSSSKTGNEDARYRDWDTLKYWFRGVEKFAPWVRNVYFVTDDQKPEWLNLNHPKLKWVKHTDFIPQEYLPTFNSNAIELNIHRIEGLSEHFVYFNDDMFLINHTKPEDFFVNGLPCDWPSIGPLVPEGFFSYMKFNNLLLINRNFSLRESIKANPKKWFKNRTVVELFKLMIYGRKTYAVGIDNWHIHTNFRKETFNILWEKEFEDFHNTSKTKQRTKENVTQWCVKDWQMMSGNFHPQKPLGRLFHTETLKYSDEAIEYLKKQKGKVICLNDTENETDFELHKKMIIDEFERIFPNKSSFEL